jgi:hypothetical protein
MEERRAAEPSAHDVLERWRSRAARPDSQEQSFTGRDAVAQLIASHLDSYAYDRLSKQDRTWWEERWNQDEDAGSFSRLFGPEWIVESMDDFFDWFVIRKVIAPRVELATYGPLCVDLLEWMGSEGLDSGSDVAGAIDRARRATEELPLADELGEFLDASGEELAPDAILEERDWENEMAAIVRIEPGALWFRSESGETVGPVRVPERAAQISTIGWKLSAARFGRAEDGWYVLEMGNVYPG